LQGGGRRFDPGWLHDPIGTVAGMVRLAATADLAAAGRLLHDFNVEFDEPTPPAEELGVRLAGLGDTAVLIAGDPPHGLAVLRFRDAIWTAGLEAHLAELYVAPEQRGRGDGRALVRAAVDLARDRGADWIDLNTDEGDVAAQALYASLGFAHTARYYELDLTGSADGASAP
jgi:ribosomal protein S18 acetylase RimI-like enzyme